jgi:Rad3-related DNA helicase
MACGLTEGLDVKGDLGRWQAILKMPFLNKSDVAVAAKLDIRPQWYNWQCIKDVEQATGRICRGPDDYGETYILDEAFARLFNNNKHLFSESFKSALV